MASVFQPVSKLSDSDSEPAPKAWVPFLFMFAELRCNFVPTVLGHFCMCEAKAKAKTLPRGDVNKAKAKTLPRSGAQASGSKSEGTPTGKAKASPKSSSLGPLRKRCAAADPSRDEQQEQPPLKRPAASLKRPAASGQFLMQHLFWLQFALAGRREDGFQC